jgi:hypothetical protein
MVLHSGFAQWRTDMWVLILLLVLRRCLHMNADWPPPSRAAPPPAPPEVLHHHTWPPALLSCSLSPHAYTEAACLLPKDAELARAAAPTPKDVILLLPWAHWAGWPAGCHDKILQQLNSWFFNGQICGTYSPEATDKRSRTEGVVYSTTFVFPTVQAVSLWSPIYLTDNLVVQTCCLWGVWLFCKLYLAPVYFQSPLIQLYPPKFKYLKSKPMWTILINPKLEF